MKVLSALFVAGALAVCLPASAQQAETGGAAGVAGTSSGRPTITNRSAAEVQRELAAEEKLREKRVADEAQLQQRRLGDERARQESLAARARVNPENLPFDEARNEFQEFVATSVGRTLPVFGHNFFENPPSTFAPVDRVPVTPDYVIGPGDEIVIKAWGQVDIDYRTIVDRNGAIHVPQIGSLTVGGLRYQDLQGYLRTAISRVYRNFDLSVNLGQLRSIQVFIVGQARYPGAYTVSSLSTLVNALFASGGPTTKGSMRAIQLKRNGGTVTEFDLYDLLLKGDKSKDVRLMPGDVIFIPPVGQLVAISGSVHQPAIYELKQGTSVGDLIALAGGLSTVAAGQTAKIERILDRRARVVDEFNLGQAGLAKSVQSGDIVRIYTLSPRFENAVSVRGFVANPGRFPWREGMRVRDVIPDAESLIVSDYWQRVNRVTRAPVREGLPPVQLQPQTGATVRPGEVQRPGGEVQRAAELSRASEPAQASDAPRLSEPQVLGEAPVRLSGLQRPGEPADASRTQLRRLFDEINWDYAAIERLNPVDLTTLIVPFNLRGAVIDGDPGQNLALRPGDIVTVFSRLDVGVPVAKQAQFVRLEGEVRTPGVYQLMPGETLRQLVTRVGGFTPNAYLYASELTRESVRVQQQKRLDEAIERLAQEVERGASARAQASVGEDKETLQSQVDTQRRLIERLRSIRATGRIVIEATPERSELRDLPELALEDGDRFFVPSKPSTVAVIGSVYNQTAFVYDSNKRLDDYLERAGGYTRNADKRRTYVVRADGTVTARAQSSFFSLSSEKMNPGDTIVVPEDVERFFLTKQLRDWTQIFAQFALGVTALKVLRDF